MDTQTLTNIIIASFGFVVVGLLGIMAFFAKNFYETVRLMGIKLDTKVVTIAACELKESKTAQMFHEIVGLLKELIEKLPTSRGRNARRRKLRV